MEAAEAAGTDWYRRPSRFHEERGVEEAKQLHQWLIEAREGLGLTQQAVDERVRQPGWCARFEASNPDKLSVTALARYVRALGGVLRVTVDEQDQWWTSSDVARYIGVKVGTVSTYRVRGTMPPPDDTLGRTHVWRPARIIAWHEGRERAGVGGGHKRPTG